MRKRGITLTEMLLVVVILGILASITLPGFNKMVTRSKFKEVGGMAHLVASAARYYEAKYGTAGLNDLIGQTQAIKWSMLSLDQPTNPTCTYTIADSVQGLAGLGLQAEYPAGTCLFVYRFDNQTCRIIVGNPNSSFIDYKYLPGTPA